MKKLISCIAMLLVSFMLQAQTINVSTGIDNAGNVLPQYATDPNWIVAPSTSALASDWVTFAWEPQPVSSTNAGWINQQGTQFISPSFNGIHDFERQFYVAPGIGNFDLNFSLAWDDAFVSLEIVRPDLTTIPITVTPTTAYHLSAPITNNIPTGGMSGNWRIRAKINYLGGQAGFMCSGYITMNTSPNYVLEYNGTGDYAYVDTPFINARSIEMWFKPSANITPGIPSGQTLIARNDATQLNEFGLYLVGSDWTTNQGRLTFFMRDNGTLHEVHSNANTWFANTWYHVAGVIDPLQGMKLYINGVPQTSTAPSGTAAISTAPEITALGRWGDAAIRHFNGRMDEVRIWDRAISQTEIQTKMCSMLNPSSETGLVTYFQMNEGSGTVINNAAGSNNGTLVTPIYIQEEVCGIPNASSCNVLYDDFSNASAWSHPATVRTCSTYYNDIDISNGAFNFYDARDGHVNFMNRSIPTLSNSNFKADIDVTATAFGPTGDVANRVLALTAGTKAFANDESSSTCISTPCAFPTMTCQYSAQMGLEVLLAGNTSNGYTFHLRQNTGAGGYTPLVTLGDVPIPSPNGIGTYYLRLERTCTTTGKLSVFSDAARTVHVAGSPLNFTLAPSFGGLNNVQLGVYEGGWHANRLTGFLDNLCISSNPSTISVTASNVQGCPGCSVNLVGSPSGGTFSVANPYSGPTTTYTYTYTDPATGCPVTSAPATITISNNLVVTGFNSTATTGNTASLTWDAIPCIAWYTIRYRPLGSSSWQYATGSAASILLTGLIPNTTYDAEIRANCSASSPGSYNSPITFSTAAPCCTPTGLAITNITSNNISINWTACPLPGWYNIRYRINGGAWVGPVSSTTPNFSLNGSTTGNTYEFQVLYKCSPFDISPWSSILNISVPSASPKPSEVSNNEISNSASNSKIKLYPNPTESNLQIDITSIRMANATIQILDMSGKLIKEQTNTLKEGSNQLVIDMQSLQSGLYFIKIQQDHATPQTFKVTKQ